MAEYIEREAAIAFMNEVEPCICFNPDGVVFAATKAENMLKFLRSIPAADVEPVVRCRDCIHLSGVTNGGTFFRCDRYDKWQDESQRVYMPLDGFCSYGQKGEKTNDS